MCPIVHMACMHFWHIYKSYLRNFGAFLSRQQYTRSVQKVFARDILATGKFIVFCVYAVILYHNFACNSPPGVPIGRDEISKRETLLFFRCSSWDAIKMYNNPTCGNGRDDFALQFFAFGKTYFHKPQLMRGLCKKGMRMRKAEGVC